MRARAIWTTVWYHHHSSQSLILCMFLSYQRFVVRWRSLEEELHILDRAYIFRKHSDCRMGRRYTASVRRPIGLLLCSLPWQLFGPNGRYRRQLLKLTDARSSELAK